MTMLAPAEATMRGCDASVARLRGSGPLGSGEGHHIALAATVLA